jgi:hypothetical protein
LQEYVLQRDSPWDCYPLAENIFNVDAGALRQRVVTRGDGITPKPCDTVEKQDNQLL